MNKEHLQKFRTTIPEAINKNLLAENELKLIGSNTSEWWKWVTKNMKADNETKLHKLDMLPYDDKTTKRFKRSTLKNICDKNSGYSDLDCAISIMTWGGQNRKHGALLFDRFQDDIQPIIQGMRQGDLSHLDAYDKFYNIWIKPQKLGMGAAYFTKLIFFCVPNHKGYIMDQWTAKSINLLTNQEVINLSQGYVSKKNNVETYKNFCDLTDKIATQLKYTGEEIELAMFSRGGRTKWEWRQYVSEKYPVTKKSHKI